MVNLKCFYNLPEIKIGLPIPDANAGRESEAMRLFLADNGASIHYTAPEAIQTMSDLAAGTLTEQQFAHWLRIRKTT